MGKEKLMWAYLENMAVLMRGNLGRVEHEEAVVKNMQLVDRLNEVCGEQWWELLHLHHRQMQARGRFLGERE